MIFRLLFLLLFAVNLSAGSFSVATYNLEFYVDQPTLGVQPKSEQSRAVIRQGLKSINADLLALQEIGSTNALLELRDSLRSAGVHYPYWEHVRGPDNNLRVAFLSKHPIKAARHHLRESYLYQGKRHMVLRGFGEIDVEFPGSFICTFITTHLKSKRPVPDGNQQEMREEEARLLRDKIDAFFKRLPNGNLIVLGDLNDGINTRTARLVLGRGKSRLIDARPHERNGDSQPSPNPNFPPRRIVWTHFYAREETYSRIDYILMSPALADNYRPEKSFVLALPNWGVGSDHRPVAASFEY